MNDLATLFGFCVEQWEAFSDAMRCKCNVGVLMTHIMVIRLAGRRVVTSCLLVHSVHESQQKLLFLLYFLTHSWECLLSSWCWQGVENGSTWRA